MINFSDARESISALLLACLATFVTSPSYAEDAWAQSGQDAGAGSFNADQTILGAGDINQLTSLWKQTGVQSSEVVESNGELFVSRQLIDKQGHPTNTIMRLNPQTGATVWQVGTEVETETPPALTDDFVIAPSYYGGNSQTSMAAYDRATGHLAWHYEHNFGTFTEAHALEGAVYFYDIEDEEIISLDAATGAQRWLVTLSGARTSPLAGNGVVVVGLISGLAALDAQDGHTLWSVSIAPARNADRPLIVGNTVLVEAERGKVFAYDLATGALRWKAASHPSHVLTDNGPMATDGQRVFVLHGQTPAKMTALDLATGARLWTVHTSDYPHNPVVSNGVIYVVEQNALQAFDTTTGSKLRIANVPSEYDGNIAIAEGRLFVKLDQAQTLSAFGFGTKQETGR